MIMRRQLPESYLLFTICFMLATGCNGRYDNEATRNLSATDKIKYQQYMVQGEQLYAMHCSNCHQEDGKGLARLIPPLAKSDYLLQDAGRTVCLIKNGIAGGEMVVNGVVYNQKMPANPALKNIEIAQIITFINNNWGNEQGYTSVREVEDHLSACR